MSRPEAGHLDLRGQRVRVGHTRRRTSETGPAREMDRMERGPTGDLGDPSTSGPLDVKDLQRPRVTVSGVTSLVGTVDPGGDKRTGGTCRAETDRTNNQDPSVDYPTPATAREGGREPDGLCHGPRVIHETVKDNLY